MNTTTTATRVHVLAPFQIAGEGRYLPFNYDPSRVDERDTYVYGTVTLDDGSEKSARVRLSTTIPA